MQTKVYKDLISEGKVVRGYLGVGIQDLTEEMAQSLGIKEQQRRDCAGSQKGFACRQGRHQAKTMSIVEFNGKPVEGSKELQSMVTAMKPGTKVKIVVLRDGERKTLNATLEDAKSEEDPDTKQSTKESDTLSSLGIDVQNLTDQLAEQLGL